MSKTFIWFGLFIGSTIGAYVPSLFGADTMTLWSILGSVVGGVVGIFAGNHLAKVLGV